MSTTTAPTAVVVADTTPLITLAGVGEIRLLTLVHMLRAQLFLVDEQKARRVAAQASIQLVGTLGLLLRAKREGHLAAIKPITDQFSQRKRYYSPTLIAQILHAAGE